MTSLQLLVLQPMPCTCMQLILERHPMSHVTLFQHHQALWYSLHSLLQPMKFWKSVNVCCLCVDCDLLLFVV